MRRRKLNEVMKEIEDARDNMDIHRKAEALHYVAKKLMGI